MNSSVAFFVQGGGAGLFQQEGTINNEAAEVRLVKVLSGPRIATGVGAVGGGNVRANEERSGRWTIPDDETFMAALIVERDDHGWIEAKVPDPHQYAARAYEQLKFGIGTGKGVVHTEVNLAAR
jgi:hypothetical protein